MTAKTRPKSRILAAVHANAHRQFTLIDERPTVERLLSALEAEHAAKPTARSGAIGFIGPR